MNKVILFHSFLFVINTVYIYLHYLDQLLYYFVRITKNQANNFKKLCNYELLHTEINNNNLIRGKNEYGFHAATCTFYLPEKMWKVSLDLQHKLVLKYLQ